MKKQDRKKVVVKNRADLHNWLQTHHTQTDSIWLISYKRGHKHYLPYNDIVEEALCFGWIDGQALKVDEKRSGLLLSPRNPKSNWSKLNKTRISKLINEGRMQPTGMAMVKLAKATGTWDALNDVENLVVPTDLAKALKAKPQAEANFAKLSRSAKRAILEWILLAKKPETRQNRIHKAVTDALTKV